MRNLFFLFVLLSMLGCAGSPHQLSKMDQVQIKDVPDRQLIICMQYNGYATDVVFNEAVSRKIISEDEVDLIKTRSLKIGMSENALIASRGFGHNVNKTVGKFGVHKQYIYGEKINNMKYAYVENGIVTGWQE